MSSTASPAGRSDESLIDEALGQFRDANNRAVRRDAERELRDIVGRLAEQLQAACAWLFEFDARRRLLVTRVTHGTNRALTLPYDGTSIVSRIARDREGAVLDDLEKVRFVHVVEGVRSALSVPVFAAAGEVIGVLHFESLLPAAFSHAQLMEMQAAAPVLLSPMLRLQAAQGEHGLTHAWSPEQHGWNLEAALGQWMHVLSEAITHEAQPIPGFAFWYADDDKGVAWVLGTTRYLYEYGGEKLLPLEESLVGEAARLEKGQVLRLKADDPRCRNRVKAARLGVHAFDGVPIAWSNDGGAPGSGALLVAYFDERPAAARLSDECLTKLGAWFGTVMSDYQRQKVAQAEACAWRDLASSRAPLPTMLHLILDVLEGDDGAIFAYTPANREAVGVASTGLATRERGRQSRAESGGGELRYRLDDAAHHGYTWYLVTHPGTCARKHSVPDLTEKGLPDGFPVRPSGRLMESGVLGLHDCQRYLGACVSQGADVFGAVRVLRPGGAKPFLRSDMDVLRALARYCREPLLDYRNRRATPELADSSRPESLLTPVTNVATFTRPLVNQLLQDLITFAGADTQATVSLDACFFELKRNELTAGKPVLTFNPLEWMVSETHGPVDFDQAIAFGGLHEHANNPAYAALSRGWILSYDRVEERDLFGVPAVRQAWPVAAQAVIPVVAWSGPNLIEGLLALSARKPITWKPRLINKLFASGLRLAALMSRNEPIPVSDLYQASPSDALCRFAGGVRTVLGSASSELYLDYNDHHAKDEPVVTYGPKLGRPDRWAKPLTHFTPHDLAGPARVRIEAVGRYGVEISPDGRVYRMPLFLGPIRIGELRWGGEADPSPNDLAGSVGCAAGFWARLSLVFSTHWDVQFLGEPFEQSATRWKETILGDAIQFRPENELAAAFVAQPVPDAKSNQPVAPGAEETEDDDWWQRDIGGG